MGGLQGWHLLIVLAVILLLFGAAKLPALAKSVGQSARVFKGEMKAMKEERRTACPHRREDQARIPVQPLPLLTVPHPPATQPTPEPAPELQPANDNAPEEIRGAI